MATPRSWSLHDASNDVFSADLYGDSRRDDKQYERPHGMGKLGDYIAGHIIFVWAFF